MVTVRKNRVGKKHIEECVREDLEAYFTDLGGAEPHSMDATLTSVVEKPLLEVATKYAADNQSNLRTSRTPDWATSRPRGSWPVCQAGRPSGCGWRRPWAAAWWA